MSKNIFILVLASSIPYSVVGMEQESNTKLVPGQLFESFKQKVEKLIDSDETLFLQCFKRITTAHTVSLEYKNDTEWTLILKGDKKSCFDGMLFKQQLTKNYKKQASIFKADFEKNNFTLGTGMGEDNQTIEIYMYLKKPQFDKNSDKNNITDINPDLIDFFWGLNKK